MIYERMIKILCHQGNANSGRVPTVRMVMATDRKTDNINCWQKCGLLESRLLRMQVQNGTTNLGNGFLLSHQAKHRLTIGSNNHIHRYPHDLKTCPHKPACKCLHIVFIICRNWKPTGCLSIGKWMVKLVRPFNETLFISTSNRALKISLKMLREQSDKPLLAKRQKNQQNVLNNLKNSF